MRRGIYKAVGWREVWCGLRRLGIQGTQMRILTYKRTHTGDPSPDGVFGVHDCMGRIRDLSYDAIIVPQQRDFEGLFSLKSRSIMQIDTVITPQN